MTTRNLLWPLWHWAIGHQHRPWCVGDQKIGGGTPSGLARRQATGPKDGNLAGERQQHLAEVRA